MTVTLDGRTNDGEAGEGDYVATDVDDVAPGSGPDALVGSDLANELYGEDGNDAVDGWAGWICSMAGVATTRFRLATVPATT